MPKPQTDKQRIVVSIDTTANAPPAIILAASLARARRRALHGLIIEDEELFTVARLPCSNEIFNTGGQMRKLSGLELERSMARIAGELRSAVEKQAQQFSLSWSCSTVRCNRRTVTFVEGSQAEVLVVAGPAQGIRTALPKQRLLLLDWDKPEVLQTLATVLEISSHQPTELLLAGNHDDKALQELLASYANASIRRMGNTTLEATLKSPGYRPAMILVARDSELSCLAPCLKLANCPVLIAA